MEERKDSDKFLKRSIIIFLPLSALVFFNFVFGFIINQFHENLVAASIFLGIIVLSIPYFIMIYKFHPFERMNSFLTKKRREWFRKKRYSIIRNDYLVVLVFLWLIISFGIIFIPYPIYHQTFKNKTKNPNQSIGIWTYGKPLDNDRKGKTTYISNEALKWLSDNDVYFVYRIGINQLDDLEGLKQRLNRLKDNNIETHVCITPTKSSVQFVNIWSFDLLEVQANQVLTFLDSNGYMGSMITTLVWDMETIPWAHFPDYNCNFSKIEMLAHYYEIEQEFNNYNEEVRNKYGLDIQICTDYFQELDYADHDEDVMSLYGQMSDPNVSMSYMVYRRDNIGMNHVLDHCKLLSDGDTILLNSWKFEGYHCWGNIECAIDECRVVLGYPEKLLNLEIWCLYYFLKSYSEEGLIFLFNALFNDIDQWQDITCYNKFPYNIYWDLVIYGVSVLDTYGPLFRLFYGAY